MKLCIWVVFVCSVGHCQYYGRYNDNEVTSQKQSIRLDLPLWYGMMDDVAIMPRSLADTGTSYRSMLFMYLIFDSWASFRPIAR